MENLVGILGAIRNFRAPLSITALCLLIFYLIVRQILELGVFSQISQVGTSDFLNKLLTYIFWLSIAGLVFGLILYALPYIIPKRLAGRVEIVDVSINEELGTSGHKEK